MRTFPAQTYSKYPDRFPPGAPVRAIRARGASVLCADAVGKTRWYLDCVNGMGSVLLGHADPTVHGAVTLQSGLGNAFPLGSALEEEVAARLGALVKWEGAEVVRYGKNGADVTGAAVKLARAATGRKMILRNAYHGHHPWSVADAPMNAGVLAEERQFSRAIPHNDMAALEHELTLNPVAAVVLEAVPSGDPEPPTPQYVEAVRLLCDRHGALLVLDEVVTGMRVAPGGAAEAYGIRPDLACYGKAMANGYALSALVGPEDLMTRFDRDVFFSTTHGGEATALAAAAVTLAAVKADDAPERLRIFGLDVRAALGRQHGLLPEAHVMLRGYLARPFFTFAKGASDRAAFLAALLERSVLCQGYINPSLATTESGTREELLAAVADAAAAIHQLEEAPVV